MWYNTSWLYRVKLTIDHTKVGSDQTDYPIYIDLSDLDSDFWANVQDGGGDIRITKVDGTTEIPREVVSCDTSTTTGEVHAKHSGTLSSSTDDEVWVYYGNSGASDYAVTDTYGRNNVWDSGYSLIAHLNEDPSGSAPQIIDSSGSGNNGTTYGSMISGNLVDGIVGKGLSHDGINDKVVFPNNTDFEIGTGDATISGLIYKRESSSGWQNLVLLGRWNTGASPGTNEWILSLTVGGSDDKLSFNVEAGTTSYSANAPTAISLNNWYYFVAVREGTNIKLFINGVLITTTAIGTAKNIDYVSARNTQTSTIDAGSYYVDGIYDELRFLKGTAKTSNLILTEFNNLTSPSTFYSVGTQENAPGGSTEYTVWNGATPDDTTVYSGGAVSLGMVFNTSIDCQVVGAMYYRTNSTYSTFGSGIKGGLYNSAGTKLAEVDFGTGVDGAWNEARFSTPIDIVASTNYTIVIYNPNGKHLYIPNKFLSTGYTNGILTAPIDDGSIYQNGYRFATGISFPTGDYNHADYGIDVIVSTGTPATSNLKYWDGSAWVSVPALKYWNGSAWVEKPLKRWNGSAWVEV